MEYSNGKALLSKRADSKVPIASITKLMTAMVVLDSHPPMDEPIRVSRDDVDTLRYSRSKLPVGWTLTRWQLLNLALMCSENRAAHALARTYPGGENAFVEAMNEKARSLEMSDSRFLDPTGLDGRNVSTAGDLVRLVDAASGYYTIRRMTTMPQLSVRGGRYNRARLFGNSNRLIHNHRWNITLSKTGYINEAGYCLVMKTVLKERPIVFVLLDSQGKNSRLGDAIRIKRWLKG